jgi:hypothetical protein
VLADVDLSLAAWLSAALPPRTEIDFGPPAQHIEGRARAHPRVSVFLHAVEEDITGMPAGEIRLRDAAGRPTGVMLPTRRYAVTYLLTAQAADPLAEHRLLGAVLVAHANQDQLGPEHLRGVLAEADVWLPIHIGRADRALARDRAATPDRSGLVLTVLAPAVPPLAQIGAPLAEALELVTRSQPPAPERASPQPQRPPSQGQPPEGPEPARRWRRATRTEP